MRFELFENGIPDTPLMCINAKNERSAWKQIKGGGIRNRTNMFSLMRVD